MVAKDSLKEKFITYLIKELDLKRDYLYNLKTIYIGGGTPTALPIPLLEKLLKYLNQFINLEILEEFTIEANPNDITVELAKLLKKYHINRVSLGVQGLTKEKLATLGRTHTKKDVITAIKNLKKVKITNINADLIYGVGNETFKDLKKELKTLIHLGVKHISTYSLILEEKTILKKLYDEKKFSLYDEDSEKELYQKIIKYLKKKKFIHYEISNFAKKGYESIHNLTYWNNKNYIGVGPSASYYLGNIRYTNVKNLEKYFQGIDNNFLEYYEKVELSIKDMMSEELIMGLRKIKGININEFQEKFNISIYDAFPIVKKLLDLKVLALKNNYLFIPSDKLYLSNEVLVNFI